MVHQHQQGNSKRVEFCRYQTHRRTNLSVTSIRFYQTKWHAPWPSDDCPTSVATPTTICKKGNCENISVHTYQISKPPNARHQQRAGDFEEFRATVQFRGAPSREEQRTLRTSGGGGAVTSA